jgi:hypothetical protein
VLIAILSEIFLYCALKVQFWTTQVNDLVLTTQLQINKYGTFIIMRGLQYITRSFSRNTIITTIKMAVEGGVGEVRSSYKQINSVETVCICKKRVVGGIRCMICSSRYHFSCTNTNKEMKKWTCKSCAQSTRPESESDERVEICKMCSMVRQKLEEYKKDRASKAQIIDILMEDTERLLV